MLSFLLTELLHGWFLFKVVLELHMHLCGVSECKKSYISYILVLRSDILPPTTIPFQVRARCRSEWAQFQLRVTNADKSYLEGHKRNGKG